MPYRSMSLEDFARHLDMDLREVRRLAERGRLPGEKVGGQWRFNPVNVTDWLEREMRDRDEQRLASIERAMGKDASPEDVSGAFVTALIGLQGIDTALPARTRASVLQELTGLAERTGLVFDSGGLLKAIREREELFSTALPNGVAIPHPRRPVPGLSAEPFLCLGRVPGGIGFGEPGGALSYLFFLICCHSDRHHLRVLARLMRTLNDDTVGALLAAETSEEILQTLIEREEAVAAESR